MQLPNRGSLTAISFIEILQDASETELTGMIRIEKGPVIKVAYLEKGVIAFASSNEKTDRLTEVLKRAGKLTPEQVEDAQTRQRPNVSLGKMLVELGYIGPKELLWGARTQVEGILHQILFWDQGNYQVLEGPLPKEIIHLNLSVPLLVFEGIAKSNDREWILKHIESPESVYLLHPEFSERNVKIQLPVERFISLMDGKKTLQEVAETANLDTFDVCKSVVALEYLGLAVKAGKLPLQMELELPSNTQQETPEEEPFESDASLEAASPVPAVEPPSKDSEEEPFPDGAGDVSLGQVLQIPTVEELQASEPAIQESEAVEPPEKSIAALSAETRVPMEDIAEPEKNDEQRLPEKRQWILILVLILAAAAAGIIWYLQRSSQSKSGSTEIPANSITEQQEQGTPETETPVTSDVPSPPSSNSAPETGSGTTPSGITASNSPASNLRKGNLAAAAASWKKELSAQRSRYTIQLAIACQEKTVNDALELFGTSEDFIVVPLKFKGQSCYRLLYGTYPTPDSAQSSLASLPSVFLQQAAPAAVVPVARVLE